jgi:cbb3-type cytochrome oxidase subunit 3
MTAVDYHSLLTFICIIAFIVMVIWVFGKKQRAQMEKNALIPLRDECPPPSEYIKGQRRSRTRE